MESFDEFKPDWETQNKTSITQCFILKMEKFEFCTHLLLFIGFKSHTSKGLCFKTPERAEQFGKQFIELFRIVLTN